MPTNDLVLGFVCLMVGRRVPRIGSPPNGGVMGVALFMVGWEARVPTDDRTLGFA